MRDRGVVSFHFLAGESFIIQRDRLKGKYRAFDDIFDNEIFFHKFPGSCFPRNWVVSRIQGKINVRSFRMTDRL